MSLLVALLFPLGLLLITLAGLAVASHPRRRRRVWGPRRRGPVGAARAVGAFWPVASFSLVAGAGLILAFAIAAALGPAATWAQPADDAIYRGTIDHQLGAWMSLNRVITDVGNSWLGRGLCVGAALFLPLLWRRHRWLPPVAMGTMLIASHYLVLGLTRLVDRAAPPGSGGTYPSGGNVRTVAIYGLVAFFFLLTIRAGRRTRVAVWTVVALLAYVEAYSRSYLAVHWVTDVIAGLIFGALLLAALIVACDAVLAGEDPTGSLQEESAARPREPFRHGLSA